MVRIESPELAALLSHLHDGKGALAGKLRQLCARADGPCVEDAVLAHLPVLLDDARAFEMDVADKICELFPAACVTCAGYAADDIVMRAPLDGDGAPLFSPGRVAACLWDCLNCDDPHAPNECGA